MEYGDEWLGEDPRVLANGYHRYHAARDLGLPAMPMRKFPERQTEDYWAILDRPRPGGWGGAR